ncbi:MAG: hypothetical protein ACPIOQ_08890 [Promethearchaeia archaeon]
MSKNAPCVLGALAGPGVERSPPLQVKSSVEMDGAWDYDIEEVPGADGATVRSLVVRFSVPEDVTSAAGIQLLFEPDGDGCALAISSPDAAGALRPTCRVGLPFEVDQEGMQAKFRKKLRSLSVTLAVLRDLRPQPAPPSAAESTMDDESSRALNRSLRSVEPVPRNASSSLATGLEDDAYDDGDEFDRAFDQDDSALVAGRDGGEERDRPSREGKTVPGTGPDVNEAVETLSLQEQVRGMALELKEQGNNLVREGKHAEALILYDQSILLFDKDPAVYTNRALCRMKTGSFQAAADDCCASLALDATFVRAHERLGAAQAAQSNFAAAVESYSAGLALDPQHKGCLLGLKAAKRALLGPGKTPPEARTAAESSKPASSSSAATFSFAPRQPSAPSSCKSSCNPPTSTASLSSKSKAARTSTPKSDFPAPMAGPAPACEPLEEIFTAGARQRDASAACSKYLTTALSRFNLELTTIAGRGRGVLAREGFQVGT